MTKENYFLVSTKYFVAFCLLCLVTIYFLLVPRYMIFNLDDAWTTSLIYNYYHHNELTDIVFEGPGLLQFGRVHAYLYGVILSFFDYRWESSLYFSMLLVIVALIVTYITLIKLGFNNEVAMVSILILMAMEPVIAIAHTARPDALNFLLITLIILCWSLKKPLLSGLLFGLGATIHPMFVMAIPYIISVTVYQYIIKDIIKVDLKKIILFFLIGTSISFSLYVITHWHELYNTLNVINNSSKRFSLDIFIKYYLEAKFFRHLPGLGILVITTFLSVYAIRRGSDRFLTYECLYALIALVLVILSLILIGRDNHYYMVYLMPALSLQITLVVYSMIKSLVHR
ncbi:MAG: hypothetical protein GXP60_04690, partial [Epsilonproteobacteria bacterium]|nr:hypothetical protein [Campylobacterota bacterium]